MASLLDIWQPPAATRALPWEASTDPLQGALLGTVAPAAPVVVDDPWAMDRYPLLQFVEEAWPIVNPGRPYMQGWHTEAITLHLEAVARRDITRLLINVPMRSGKSNLLSVFFQAWVWITHPEESFLCTSYRESLALRDSVACRTLIRSPWYRERWGDRFRFQGDMNIKSRFANDRGGYRITAAVGGATGEGASFLIADDMHGRSEEKSTSRADIEAAKNYFNAEFSGCLADPQTSCIIVSGQRVAIDDISASILAKGGYVHLKIRQEYVPPPPGETEPVTAIGWRDPRTRAGELMWPQRFREAEIAAAKSFLGMHLYRAFHQQDPEGSGGELFNDTWWQVYTEWPDPAIFQKVILSWDMRFKDDKEAGSFVVGQCWGLSPNGLNAYLLDEVRGRWGYVETKEAFTGLCKKWPMARIKLIENKANGPAIYSDFRSKVFGLVLVEPEGGKDARARKHTSSAEAGHIWLPSDTLCPWIAEWRDEAKHYPSEPNDRIDAATQAWDYLLPRQLADDPKTEERRLAAKKQRLMKRVMQQQRIVVSRTGV